MTLYALLLLDLRVHKLIFKTGFSFRQEKLQSNCHSDMVYIQIILALHSACIPHIFY